MQVGYILLLTIFLISLKGYCEIKCRKGEPDLCWNITHSHYRVVAGEIFMMPMPCIKPLNPDKKSVWYKTKDGTGGTSFNSGQAFPTEAKHSGNYTHGTGGSELRLYLQVVEKSTLECPEPEKSSICLPVNLGGMIPCPCSNNTRVVWYKLNHSVSDCYYKEGVLHLKTVTQHHTGVFFCDRQIFDGNVTWIMRRAINVTVKRNCTAERKPRILAGNTPEEVEIGHNFTLPCRVYSPSEMNFSLKVRWYMDYGSRMEPMIPLVMKGPKCDFEECEVTQSVFIKKVTPEHLNHIYTCIASNSAGNTTLTVKLKRKHTVKWPPLVWFPVVCFVVVTGVGIVIHLKWLELQLIYRSHFPNGEHEAEEKEFDVFLSYVWTPQSAEVAESLSSKSPYHEEACLRKDLLKTEVGKETKRPLETLLCRVLEEQWGYSLCLLERDVLPGGAYANDVVLAIKRSQMLICILSAEYITNSNAVFVLESGIQALLQNSTPKLLLLWTCKASFIQPDPPLPTIVQKALKVLPSLDWSANASSAKNDFWRSLKRAMPKYRVDIISGTQHL
ncbi:interleukin-18 receptor accessory protein-like [Pholidichthys leucotaenia]